MEIEGAKDISIELNSLSKSHNMAGWRLGMLTSNPTFIKNIITIKSNMDSGMYKPLQIAAADALGNDIDWYNSINNEYIERRKLVWKLFDCLGAEYDKKQTGLFVWAKIPQKYNDAMEFSDNILNKTKVFITPGNIFGSNGNNYARISLCSSSNTLTKAIERINK